MKISVSRTIFVLFSFAILSQSAISQVSPLIRESAKKKLDPFLQQALITKEQFPQQKVTSVEYYSKGEITAAKTTDVVGVLIQANNSSSEVIDYVRSMGGTIGSRHGNIFTAFLPINNISTVAESPSVRYVEASKKLFQSLDLSLAKTGADVLHNITDPTKKLTGKGIIVGFTDSGINTWHPNFRTPNGKTRILYIWDQYSFGTPPAGFTYGNEKDSSAINAGTYWMYDDGYHGTHVSGIAAGNGLPAKQYVGMAPEADIIMVANKGDDLFNRGLTTVGTLDGYDYIRTKANALGRRHVINTSQGTNLGPHDGTTLFEQALNADAAAGTIFCLAAGNEATSNRHASAIVTTGSAKEIETYVSGGIGMTIPMDIWYNTNDRLTLQIKKSSDISYIATFPAVDSTIIYNFPDVQVSVTTKIGSPLNGDNEIYIAFMPTTSISVNMKLKFTVEPGNTLPDGGRVDLWWERNYSVYFITNTDQTMTFGIPAGADSAITVGSYNNRTNYGVVNDISSFSGRGPRRDGKIKPDIAGLGGEVISSVSSSNYTSFSGTSMSSPHVAGAVALLLQQDTSLTGYQIKEKLKASAIADGFTGAVPNGIWGYGKLNVLKATGYKGFALTSITPDSVLFGSVFVNSQKSQVLTLKNLSYENVSVTNVITSNPKISVNKTAFTIPARGENSVTVSVLPVDTGSFNSHVEIISSDTASQSIKIPVLGRGDFKPLASITPDSLPFTVNEGDSTDAIVTISNSGQGPLTFKIEADYQLQNLAMQADVQSTMQQHWGSEFSTKANGNSNIFTAASLPLLPLVIKDPLDDASTVDVSEVRGEAKKDSLFIQFVTATTLNPSNFSGIVGLDIDQNQATGIKLPYGLKSHDVGCDFYFYISGLYYSSIYLYDSSGYYFGSYTAQVDTAGKRFTIAIPLNKLKNDEGVINIAGVVGTGYFSTDYVPNEGHGTIGLQWLVVNPKEGAVAPVGSQQVNVRVRTRDLDGGKFKANMIVSTNDPDKATVTIPVSLTVVGNPNLVVKDSISFPLVYKGFPDTVDLVLGNNGTDNLLVSNVTVSDPQLSIIGLTSFTIQKNKTAIVKLVFNPTAIGNFSGSITIVSNDPGTPSVPVYITAAVADPPVIAVTPVSFDITLSEGDSTFKQLTISNTGLGTLYWKDRTIAKSDTDYLALFGASSLWERYTQSKNSKSIENYSQQYKYFAPSNNSQYQQPISLAVPDFPLFGTNSSGIHQLNPATGEIRKTIPFPLSGGPEGLTYDGHFLYLINGYTNSIFKIDPVAGVILDTINVIPSSSIDGLATDGKLLYVLDYGSSKIYSLNPITKTIIATLTPGFSLGGGITFAGKRNSIFVSNFGSGMYELNPKTGEVLQNFPTPQSISVIGVAYSNSADILILSGSGKTIFLNPASHEILGSFNSGFSSLAADEVGVKTLALVPQSGTIVPNTSQEVNVKINVKGMSPGIYDDKISLVNNDPAHNPKDIPITLHIKGRPVIIAEPDTFTFAHAFVGIQYNDSLKIRNEGSDQLQVFDITSSDSIFHFNKKTFTVEPHSFEKIAVTFMPHDTGMFSATFAIASNDSGRLTVEIPVHGFAAYPPVISVSPDSLIVKVDEGDSTIQTLSIGNLGKGELFFALERSGYPEPFAAVMENFGKQKSESASYEKPKNQSITQFVQPYASEVIAGKKVLLIENSLPWNSNANEQILTLNNIPYDIINSTTLSSTNLSSYHVVIIPSDQTTSYYNDIITNKNKIDSYVERGGILEFHAAAWGWAGGSASNVVLPGGAGIVQKSSSLNLVKKPSHPLVKSVPILFTGGSASHSYLSNLPVGANVIVVDTIAPTLIEYNYGAGKVVASGQTLEYGYANGQSAGKILMNLIPYCLLLQGGDWLSFNPDSGNVAPNATQPVDIKFNSKLLSPGDYFAGVQINNNDPLQIQKIIPVKFHVTGKPILKLEPDSLIKLSLFVGVSRKDTLHVKNIGTEPLAINSITASDTTIKINKTSFTVPPFSQEKLLVTITASDSGNYFGKLTLASNDSKKPTVDFVVKGIAKYPPVFSISADTLIFTVEEGDSAEQTITFSNTGLSELIWSNVNILPVQQGNASEADGIDLSKIDDQKTNSSLLSGENELLASGSIKVLIWKPDTILAFGFTNTINAIKQYRSNVIFDTSMTFSPSAFASKLNNTDVCIIPAQAFWDLSAVGSAFSSLLTSFVESGHTLIVMDGYPYGSTSFLNGTGLLDINVIGWGGGYNVSVMENTNPLVEGIPSTFITENTSNTHTSIKGNQIAREPISGFNAITARSIGNGFVVYLGMDFANYNSHMAKILSNAVGLSLRSKLISLNPEQGNIPAGGSQETVVKCQAKEVVSGEYYYDIVLSSNDPAAVTKNIFVKITVQTPFVEKNFALHKGLNLISWNISKSDSASKMFSPVMNSLSSVTGFYGIEKNFYPSNPVSSTLKMVDNVHGYWVVMNDTASLHMEGRLVQSQLPVHLSSGYNLVSYLGRYDDSVRSAFRSILGNIEWIMSYSDMPLVFDPKIPAEFNTLKFANQGRGYWVKLKSQDTLVYPSIAYTGTKAVTAKQAEGNILTVHSKEWINVWGKNVKINDQVVPAGTEITAIDNNGTLCGQTTFFANGSFGIMPVFKDDSSTIIDEGVKQGEFITFRIGNDEINKKLEWKNFGDVIDFNNFLMSAPGEVLVPKVFALHQNFPNPFNPTTTINYDIPKTAHVTLEVYNILGKHVQTLVNEERSAGYYSSVWNAQSGQGSVASGIYFARLRAGEYVKTVKLVFIK